MVEWLIERKKKNRYPSPRVSFPLLLLWELWVIIAEGLVLTSTGCLELFPAPHPHPLDPILSCLNRTLRASEIMRHPFTVCK